ncbi:MULTISPECIES: colicin V family bacteriocin [Pseudomonas]|uniref:colicin V family bacteriocin n=1 Tax=Pseudomonas TaxID=286 RepID=UPI000C7B382A|nr:MULTISPECIES: colicin V family bacteriocin [Pseudomonas]PLR60015.1 hypothetical protein QCBJ_28640 [Pseudomonas sp. QC2]WPN22355.1 colicin V family bacteriocin [Pseudomonas marginalis]
MRSLTNEELVDVYGAQGGMTVSAETIGASIGATVGNVYGGNLGAMAGGIIGGAVGNYLTGTRQPGSVSTSGIPWGASFSAPSNGS